MQKEDRPLIKKVISVCTRILVIAGVVVIFYKLPGLVSDKISYYKLKNMKLKQNYGGSEDARC